MRNQRAIETWRWAAKDITRKRRCRAVKTAERVGDLSMRGTLRRVLLLLLLLRRRRRRRRMKKAKSCACKTYIFRIIIQIFSTISIYIKECNSPKTKSSPGSPSSFFPCPSIANRAASTGLHYQPQSMSVSRGRRKRPRRFRMHSTIYCVKRNSEQQSCPNTEGEISRRSGQCSWIQPRAA